MNIKDFLNLENQKLVQLTGKDKADALLTSVINELITKGDLIKSDTQNILSDTQAVINFMNKIDYRSELLVAKQFLEYFIDSGNFNLIAMPYPDTKEEKERNNEIKVDLQKILIQ